MIVLLYWSQALKTLIIRVTKQSSQIYMKFVFLKGILKIVTIINQQFIIWDVVVDYNIYNINT